MDFSEKLKQLFAKILDEEELSFGDMFEKFHKDFEELVPEGRKFQPEDMYTMFSYKEIVACLINYGPLFYVKKISDKKLKIENCNGILFRAFCSLQNAILPLKDEARISPNQLIGSASIIFAQACKRGGVNYRVFYNREAFCVYPERLTIRDLGARADRASWKMVKQNLLTGEKKTFQIPTNSGKKTFITPKDLSAWAIKNLEHGRFWASLCAVLPTWEVAMVMGYYEEAGHEITDDAKTIIGRAIHNVYEGEPSKLEKKIADKFTLFGLSNPPKEVAGDPVFVSGKTVYELLDTLYVHKGEGKYPVIDDITKRDMNTGFNA